jgi:hypothetical protein
MEAVLFGPFVGELYWECGRFAPMLPYYKLNKYKGKEYKYIVMTREDRFDLYGKYADILIPLRIDGDYITKHPNCFRLNGFKEYQYHKLIKKVEQKYSQRYRIVEHVYPDISKSGYVNKYQFSQKRMMFRYRPRDKNYDLVREYMPKDKPYVILAPRYRDGFKRNWNRWPQFYDKLASDEELLSEFNFIICGKKEEYVPDEKHRFYDMNDIELIQNTSLVGLLLVLMENAFFTFGSQSAIPNISLLYNVDVLEFGCQKRLHTQTYNVKNTPIKFIENSRYDIGVKQIYSELKKLLKEKRRKCNAK